MVEQLEIIARKRSEDPLQEKLRERKAQWNKEVKTLIAQLIAFKRGLNGKGDPRAGLPASNIKHPFPDEIGRYLDEMATRYQKVVDEAGQIIDAQKDYSQHRRKSRKETPMSAPIPVAASSANVLEKYGSWWGSRVWTWVTQYPIIGGHEADRNRIALLNTSTALIKYLDETEKELVRKSPEAVPAAVYKLLAMHSLFDNRFIKIFNRMMTQHHDTLAPAAIKGELPPPPEPASEPVSEPTQPPAPKDPQEALRLLRDILLIDIHHVSKLLDIAKQMKKITPAEYKILADDYKLINKVGGQTFGMLTVALKADNVREEDVAEAMVLYRDVLIRYNKLLNAFKGYLNVNGNRFKTLLEQAEDQYKKIIGAMYGPEIEKLAQKSLQRWWRRTRLGLFPNEEDRMKRDVLLKTQELTRMLNHMQDLLEDKSTTAIQVLEYVADIAGGLGTVFEMIKNLAEHNNAVEAGFKVKETKRVSQKIDRENIIKLERYKRYYNELSDFLHKTVVPAGV